MFYVVLPYNDNQVVDDLVAFSEEQWLAVEYANGIVMIYLLLNMM